MQHLSLALTPTLSRERERELNLPHHLLAEAVDFALSGERDQAHAATLAGLEADGRAGRNVEPEALCFLALEFQRRIGLEEMIVRADLAFLRSNFSAGLVSKK